MADDKCLSFVDGRCILCLFSHFPSEQSSPKSNKTVQNLISFHECILD